MRRLEFCLDSDWRGRSEVDFLLQASSGQNFAAAIFEFKIASAGLNSLCAWIPPPPLSNTELKDFSCVLSSEVFLHIDFLEKGEIF